MFPLTPGEPSRPPRSPGSRPRPVSWRNRTGAYTLWCLPRQPKTPDPQAQALLRGSCNEPTAPPGGLLPKPLLPGASPHPTAQMLTLVPSLSSLTVPATPHTVTTQTSGPTGCCRGVWVPCGHVAGSPSVGSAVPHTLQARPGALPSRPAGRTGTRFSPLGQPGRVGLPAC